MEYRRLAGTGLSVSEVSLGTEHLDEPDARTVRDVILTAVQGGVNFVDLILNSTAARDKVCAALREVPDTVMVAGHLGMDARDGSTTRDLALCEASYLELLDRMGRGSADILMLHVVDKHGDFDGVFAPGGLHDVALRLRDRGRARFIALSTHVASIGLRAVERGIDILMFPVNPAHDLISGDAGLQAGWTPEAYGEAHRAGGPSAERRDLYVACQRRGAALLAIKTFAGGLLLPAGRPSSFLQRTRLADRGRASGITLTPVQCLSYALSRPGVATAVAGCRSPGEVEAALAYERAGDAERDFSAIDANSLWKLQGRCVYCEHCLPCPSGIRIGALLRMLDVAQAGGAAAIEPAYRGLEAHGGDCTACGICEGRCPFGVPVAARMEQAVAVFGR
jgi:predicted aldo/keto reductase-like oxidoreductase